MNREAIKQMFGGRCAYCGVVLNDKWHVDHVEPLGRQGGWVPSLGARPGHYRFTGKCLNPENEREGNYFPACPPCNINKADLPLEDWRTYLAERIVATLRRRSAHFRHAERFTRVKVNEEPLLFWFERYRIA